MYQNAICMLMSVELKGYVTWFIYFLHLLWVRYNCAKFHHCRICVRDFREYKIVKRLANIVKRILRTCSLAILILTHQETKESFLNLWSETVFTSFWSVNQNFILVSRDLNLQFNFAINLRQLKANIFLVHCSVL